MVRFQRQFDSINFDLSSAFDLVSRRILLHKRFARGLFDGTLNRCRW